MSSAILKWLGGSDTGLSSKAIALTALGEMPKHPEAPRDGSDFGRCYRLLEAAPEARAGLEKLATDGGPYWAAIVPRWNEIAAAYLRETVKREGSTYDLMRSILDPVERADPSFIRLSGGATMRFGR